MRTLRLAATAVAAVTAATLVAGCSGDDAEPGASPSETSSPSPTQSASGGSTEPSDAAATGGVEGTASATATDLTSGTAPPPATAAPTPSGAVATGTLAEGFPTDVVPLLPGSTITVSTVTPVEGSRTVSLSGTTAAPAEEVLAFYRAALVGQGFVESAGAQAAGFPTATFSRNSGADLLVLAVTTLEGVQSFTLGGALAG